MKNKNFLKITALIILAVFFLTSCGLPPPGTPLTPEEREEAKNKCIAQHVAVGAIGGAVFGALIGGRKATVGAIAGAVAGGALAYLLAWGKCTSYFSDLNTFPVAGYRETLTNERYNPKQGDVVRIKDFSVSPGEVKTGDKVNLNGSYYLMAPKEKKDIKVVEKRALYWYNPEKKEWQLLGEEPREITAELGTRKANGSWDIYKEVEEGKYKVEMTVEAMGKKDVAASEFYVKKATAMERVFKILAQGKDAKQGDSYAYTINNLNN